MHSNTANKGAGKPASPAGLARGFLARLENLFLMVAVTCTLGLCVVITYNVIVRFLGVGSIPDEVVIVGEMMIGVLILPLAFVAADRGFIAVEIFTQKFGPKSQQFLNLLTALVGLLAVTPITYSAYLSVVDAFESGSYFYGLLELPEWPGHTLFFLGYFLFFLRLIDLAIWDLLVLLGVIVPRCEVGIADEEAV